jgi:hypothetical protein
MDDRKRTGGNRWVYWYSASIDLTVEIDKQGLAGVTTKRLVDSTTMVFFGLFHITFFWKFKFHSVRRDLTFMSGICALHVYGGGDVAFMECNFMNGARLCARLSSEK